MSVEVQIRKFHNQFYNGITLLANPATFTHFLLGFVGQKMKRITQVAVKWSFSASSANTVEIVSGENTITRVSGSWHDDGFQVGDGIQFNSPTEGFEERVVTNITDLVMIVSVDWTLTFTSSLATIKGTTKLLGVNYLSNLIENDDPVGYISKVDQTSTRKFTGEFTEAEYDASTLITANASGLINSWKQTSDVVTMRVIQQTEDANDWTTIYEISEVFTIAPFLDSISNLEVGVKPNYLADTASLRSVARFELLHTLLNPILKHALDDSDNPDTNGNVGYYDEHANGFTPVQFSKDIITYVNASGEDKIVIDEVTSITAKIDSLDNVLTAASSFQLNIVFLNEDLEPSDNIDTNFAFDTVFGTTIGLPHVGENGIITNAKGTIVADQLVVTADFTFTPAQQSLIEDGKYLISIATNEVGPAIDQSVLVNVLMDVNDFIKNNDVPDLMSVDTNLFYEHPYDKGTQGTSDFQGWVEDGILMSSDFALDLSKGAVINNMNVRIMAFNPITDEDFEIANIPIDFASAIISGGVQQIDIDSERGFKLVADSQFNFLKVKTMAKVGDLQHYDLDIGFKLQWMDWQALAEADPVFFDNAKINNGLNRLTSNYSALNDYDIVMFIDSEVSNGLINTDYRFISPTLRTYEYEADDTGSPSVQWLGLVETFDQSANNLSANLHGTENTEVKITFTALTGLISTVPLYAIPRLEEFQQGGLFNIFELSTFRNAAIDNPMVPKGGQSKPTFTVFADRVEVEFAIDFTKLNPASQYKISCRLGTSCEEITGCAWQPKNSTTSVVLRGIDFNIPTVGLSCGDGGIIIKSTDSGETWDQKPSGVGFQIRDIQFSDANTVFACGGNGFVIKSTDTGETWDQKNPPTPSALFDLSFIDENIGWVCGGAGRIFKTTDGGDNWTDQTILGVGITFFHSIFFIDANNGWVVGSNGIIYDTIDGGTNWNFQSGAIGSLQEVMFVDANTGWIIGDSGTVLLTTDGGATWDPIQILVGNGFKSIYFSDLNNGIVCSTFGKIYRTSDGGNTWFQQTSGVVDHLYDAITFGSDSGVICGVVGAITKYECSTTGCVILQSGKLKEDGTQKLTQGGNNKITE